MVAFPAISRWLAGESLESERESTLPPTSSHSPAQLRCVLCFSALAPRHEPHKKRRSCRQPVWKLRHDVRIEMIKKAGCASL
jgi:hypothetical protein